jgi:hypothetical protein
MHNVGIVNNKEHTMTKIKRLKQSQKLRIIIDKIGIYTTAKQIRWGLFGFTTQNAAAQKALDALEFQRSGSGVADGATIGLCGTWEGHQVQLDILV